MAEGGKNGRIAGFFQQAISRRSGHVHEFLPVIAVGVSPHGDNWKEFVYMVEGGMPAMEAIQSATVGAAQLLDEWNDLGSIEVGKYADIIAVHGDPLTDIEAMGNVNFVMKGGEVYKD